MRESLVAPRRESELRQARGLRRRLAATVAVRMQQSTTHGSSLNLSFDRSRLFAPTTFEALGRSADTTRAAGNGTPHSHSHAIDSATVSSSRKGSKACAPNAASPHPKPMAYGRPTGRAPVFLDSGPFNDRLKANSRLSGKGFTLEPLGSELSRYTSSVFAAEPFFERSLAILLRESLLEDAVGSGPRLMATFRKVPTASAMPVFTMKQYSTLPKRPLRALVS